MKHLVPDLKYCKKLKEIIKDCEFQCITKGGGAYAGRDTRKKIKMNTIKYYPAPTAGEMIKWIEKNHDRVSIIYDHLGTSLMVGKKNEIYLSNKKLENALAKALIELNKRNEK